MTVETTRVAIVGGGPAGLLLSQLLDSSGIDHVVIESRSRAEIATTQRAGILEQSSADALVAAGMDRVLRDGDRHDGIYLRFDGQMHHLNFRDLVGRSVYLYPQTEIFKDLAAARTSAGADIRWEAQVVDVLDGESERPGIAYTDAHGHRHEVRADLVIGADGSHSTVRQSFPEDVRRTWSHEYPYAWFGIIVEAPRSADELIYCESDRGFALISQRTATHQRMYFQCDAETDPDAWTDERIWEQFRARTAGGDGFQLNEGPIIERAVLRFRSSVVNPMRLGRVVLAGDAAHTVPPTGAKGLNLAIADVVVLHEVLEKWARSGDDTLLDEYGKRSSERVWRAQHFSAWMSKMMHTLPDEPPFERRRRLAELRTLTDSESGRRYLAEGYTGWEGI